MDNTELHYISYDPEEIWLEMVQNYVEAGGDILYPGDEKEILLRGVLANLVQMYAAVDNSLRMQTLRYAVGEYLDIYGETRGCTRLPATTATGTVRIITEITGTAKTIEAGTTLSADGKYLYKTTRDLSLNGRAQALLMEIEAVEAGKAGNGLTSGTSMYFVHDIAGISSITVITAADGGRDEEDDDTYRERIRTYGLSSVTTGPASQYEAAAKAFGSFVVDAKALRSETAGQVDIVLLFDADYFEPIVWDDGTVEYVDADWTMEDIKAALDDTSVRPLTDTLNVIEAEAVTYKLVVKYTADAISQSTIDAAVQEYIAWQNNTIGQAFNPDRLTSMLYQAGATRVIIDSSSQFNGSSTIEYTEITDYQRCKGGVTATRVS